MTMQLPQFLSLDGEYGANALGLPFRYLVTEGIVTTGAFEVTENDTPNMSVTVAAGVAFVLGDDDTSQQPNYLVFNDGDVNVALAAADVTNDRIDLIVAQVRDSVFSGANDDGRLIAITGTPAPSPVAPALPNNCLLLAEVLVEANETTILDADITDRRALAAPGGELAQVGKLIIVCTTATRPGDPDDGQVIWDTTTNQLLIWSDTAAAWVLPEPARPASSMYVIQCTSGTRPGSPVDGQPIFETDTDEALHFSAQSSGWVRASTLVDYTTFTGSQNLGTAGAAITGSGVTFTALANRRYRVTGHCHLQGNVGERVALRLRADTASIQSCEQTFDNNGVNNRRTPFVVEMIHVPGAGSVTYDLFGVNLSSNASLFADNTSECVGLVTVEDAGPV